MLFFYNTIGMLTNQYNQLKMNITNEFICLNKL